MSSGIGKRQIQGGSGRDTLNDEYAVTLTGNPEIPNSGSGYLALGTFRAENDM